MGGVVDRRSPVPAAGRAPPRLGCRRASYPGRDAYGRRVAGGRAVEGKRRARQATNRRSCCPTA
jgi:hypothetical protein